MVAGAAPAPHYQVDTTQLFITYCTIMMISIVNQVM